MALRAESFLRKELSEILTSCRGFLFESDDRFRRTGELSGVGWYDSMISRRISESWFSSGENLWSELRIVAPGEDARISADCPAIGKDKASIRKNISKVADFRMEGR